MRKGNGAEMGRLGAGRCVDKRYEESGMVRDRKARHRRAGTERVPRTPLKDSKVDKGKDRDPDV